MPSLDLHGLMEYEAVSRIRMFALDVKDDGYGQFEVITGYRGKDTLKRVVEDFCNDEGYSYTMKNSGSYIVTIF
ncbi:MAG: Smr/MutS family protein [Mycoplasma sp.]|nr:Smr/MutS family protein [Mycoplasma sp.]